MRFHQQLVQEPRVLLLREASAVETLKAERSFTQNNATRYQSNELQTQQQTHVLLTTQRSVQGAGDDQYVTGNVFPYLKELQMYLQPEITLVGS